MGGLILLLLACTPDPPPTPLSSNTPIVMVLLDTVRADHLSLYGYPVQTSPHLDAMPHTVVFEDNQANCSWTRPSMGSILTGRMPRSIGLYEEEYDQLPVDAELLSERLQQAGYNTLGVTSNPNLNTVFGFDQGFDSYSNAGVQFHWMKGDAPTMRRNQPLDDAQSVTDRALDLVEHRSSDGPVYLQVVYIDPHWPYVQPAAHEAAVKNSKKPGYDGGIHYIDAELRRLLLGLKQRGLSDPLLIVVADHGEGLSSHPSIPNTAGHGYTLYDSVLHVPLLFSHPTFDAQRVRGRVENLDVARTVLDLVGVDASGFGGVTLAPTLHTGTPPPEHRYIVAESDFRAGNKLSIRSASWTLIRNDDARHLRAGRYEGKELNKAVRAQLTALPDVEMYRRGVVASPERRARSIDPQLLHALQVWEASTTRRPPTGRTSKDGTHHPDGTFVPTASGDSVIPLDPSTREALKALGYLSP